MELAEQKRLFFQSEVFAVVGASNRRHKFGNKVLRCYLQDGLQAIPVHPTEKIIEGVACVASVSDLPESVSSLSIITPPRITEQVVAHAVEKGIANIWIQPGAESGAAVNQCLVNGINLIHGGPCLLVELGFLDH